jgi:hypothetical protein
MRSSIQFLAAIAVLLATATVTAQVYKWVDKDGKVQYSDQAPPAGANKAEPKRLSDPPAAADGAGKPATAIAKDGDKRRQEQAKKAEEAGKKAADEAERAKLDAENCRNARAALRDLESGRPMMRTDESGERAYLSDEQRQAEMTRAREAAATSCK